MSRRRLYHWQNDRYATRPCLPVLYIEAAWVRSNTFCACLEGAHTIEKTIGTLMTVVVSFMHRIGLVVDIKILSCKHRAAEIARRRREIFTLLVY